MAKEPGRLCQFCAKIQIRIFAASPCRSSTPAAKVFHFLILANGSSPSPKRLSCCCFWLLFHSVYPFVYKCMCVCVGVCLCVCIGKAWKKTRARAFHHRHNLNSNINNLKWFVFFIRLAMVKAFPPAVFFFPHPHPVAVFLCATFPTPLPLSHGFPAKGSNPPGSPQLSVCLFFYLITSQGARAHNTALIYFN